MQRLLAGTIALLAACGCGGNGAASDSAAAAEASVRVAENAAAGRAAAAEACPATGLWSQCAIVQRLERAGLAPRLDSAPVRQPPLTATGFGVTLNRGQLEVYLYPDSASRERAQASLDRTRYVDYTASLTMQNQSTLIGSGNALAILRSHNDHLRERVGDVLTAGAPAGSP